jgi:hypothetical protein
MSMNDLRDILSFWSGKFSGNFLPAAEVVQCAATFVMPDNQGRLRVALQPGIRLNDRKELLQLQLTARCLPRSSDRDTVFASLDLGHEWVVRGFADLTSEKMHKLWKRKR